MTVSAGKVCRTTTAAGFPVKARVAKASSLKMRARTSTFGSPNPPQGRKESDVRMGTRRSSMTRDRFDPSVRLVSGVQTAHSRKPSSLWGSELRASHSSKTTKVGGATAVAGSARGWQLPTLFFCGLSAFSCALLEVSDGTLSGKLCKTGQIVDNCPFSRLLALHLLLSGDESFSRRRICAHLR